MEKTEVPREKLPMLQVTNILYIINVFQFKGRKIKLQKKKRKINVKSEV